MAKAPSAGPLGSIPGQGTRSHMLKPRVHLPQLKIPLLLRRLTITRMAPASVTQSCLTLCNPVDCSPPGSSVHGIPQARILEWVCHFPPPGNLPNPGIGPKALVSPALQADSLLAEPSGKSLIKAWCNQINKYLLISSYAVR